MRRVPQQLLLLLVRGFLVFLFVCCLCCFCCRGDGPRVGLDYESFTSLRVSLQTPPTLQPFPIDRFLVQWSQSPTFNDSVLALPVSWAAAATQAVNESLSVPLRVALPSGTATTTILATMRNLHVTPDTAGSMLVELGSPLPHDASVTVAIPGLLTSVAYFVRASCNNAMFRAADSVGPPALSTPTSLSPLPPLISSVLVAAPTLPCAGGQALTVSTAPPPARSHVPLAAVRGTASSCTRPQRL
jgi:hypothetical protein